MYIAFLAVAASLSPGAPHACRHAVRPSTPRVAGVFASAPAGPSGALLPLSDLQPGQQLVGTVVQHHADKLYLEVPVSRAARGGRLRPLNAQLNLRRGHPLLEDPQATVGSELTVFVCKAQLASARLRVTLRDPAAQVARPLPRASEYRLEDLAPGTPLRGTITSAYAFGYFCDVGATRGAKGGVRKRVSALLPLDQAPSTLLAAGSEIELVVLRPTPGNGKLLVTADTEMTAESIGRERAQREQTTKRWSRRPSFAALAKLAGSEREGTVVELTGFGAVVNVGAQKPGLVHLSQLGGGAGGVAGGFVAEPADVVGVGDRVLVSILPRSNERRLSLRLLKVFPRRGETLAAAELAMLRRGETANPKFKRAEDRRAAARGGAPKVEGPARCAEAAEEEDPFVWAAGGDEEDPFAWAAAAADGPGAGDEPAASRAALAEAAPAPAGVAPADAEEPFAWAAGGDGGAPSDAAGPAPAAAQAGATAPANAATPADATSVGPADEAEDGDDPFDDEYFLDNYEQDSY